MRGLGGFIMGIAGFVVTSAILVLVGLYCLIVSDPNLKLLYAALVAFVIMAIFFWIVRAQDRGQLDFRNSLFDTLGPAFIGVAVVAAVITYVVA